MREAFKALYCVLMHSRYHWRVEWRDDTTNNMYCDKCRLAWKVAR